MFQFFPIHWYYVGMAPELLVEVAPATERKSVSILMLPSSASGQRPRQAFQLNEGCPNKQMFVVPGNL